MEQADRPARLESLFAAHAPAVLAYARRRADSATADDVLSDVFVVAWRRLDQIPADALPWLLACARNMLADTRRGERRRAALFQRLATNVARVEPAPELTDRTLADALMSLPARDRELLLLLSWEGLSAGQAAKVLGCSRRALSMRRHRARKRLSAALLLASRTESRSTLEAFND
jgi:RNA polymerase sigma-70 factor (ECF subfamily)